MTHWIGGSNDITSFAVHLYVKEYSHSFFSCTCLLYFIIACSDITIHRIGHSGRGISNTGG